jgi:hypothetical protein
MLLRSFYDGTVNFSWFPERDCYPCEVSNMGQLPLRGFHDGKDIVARVSGWDGYSCFVSRMGRIVLKFPERDRYSYEVWTVQTLLRVFHDGTVFPARRTGWDVSARFPHWDILMRGSQNETDIIASFTRKDRSSAIFTRYKSL